MSSEQGESRGKIDVAAVASSVTTAAARLLAMLGDLVQIGLALLPAPLRRIVAVFRFEMGRTRTAPRMFTWALLAAFPIFIMTLFRIYADGVPEQAWGLVLYAMVPQVICLLGLLLWVAPVLQSELEGRTWVYLAIRPGGKFATLAGKYLNGVGWTAAAAWTGLTVGMLIGQPDVEQPLRLWLVMSLVVLLACLGYGAAYALIGALFHRRAMVISVAYMLIVEVFISNVPAVIARFTVQHRLLNILFGGMGWSPDPGMPPEVLKNIGGQPLWHHVMALSAYTFVMLALAALVLRSRVYVTAEEN